jgi:hypothetical protein
MLMKTNFNGDVLGSTRSMGRTLLPDLEAVSHIFIKIPGQKIV